MGFFGEGFISDRGRRRRGKIFLDFAERVSSGRSSILRECD